MNDSLNHEDPIEEAAADWLALRAEGFSSAQKREFARWCRADPRHAAAVARLWREFARARERVEEREHRKAVAGAAQEVAA